MSKLVVEVCEVENVRPHPDADKLDICIIKGWQVVVGRGEFERGNLCVYFPPATCLPLEKTDSLGITNYTSFAEGQGQRIRQAKLRGEPSFGFAMKAEEGLILGQDVANRYEATKYNPPLFATAGDEEAEHELFSRYTDIENIRNFPNVFIPGEDIVATEKIDGTSARLGLIEGEWYAGSKRMQRTRPTQEKMAHHLYWHSFLSSGIKSMIKTLGEEHKSVILYGETYGSIRPLKYGIEGKAELGFRAFDIKVDEKWLNADYFRSLCYAFYVPMVPVITPDGEDNYHFKYKDFAQISDISNGKTTVSGNHIREGVVIRPVKERHDPTIGRVVLKMVSDNYLMSKYGKDDFTDA